MLKLIMKKRLLLITLLTYINRFARIPSYVPTITTDKSGNLNSAYDFDRTDDWINEFSQQSVFHCA